VGERAFRLQHRASLEVAGIAPYQPIEGKEGDVEMTIVNKGDVGAVVSVHWGSRIDRSVRVTETQATNTTEEYRLDPGSGMISVKIPPLDIAHIRVIADPHNASALFLFGYIRYKDESGNAGTVDFCWYSRPTPKWQKCVTPT
jgi:hypothetical protein